MVVGANPPVGPVISQSPLLKALKRISGGVYLSAPTVLSMDEVRHIYMMDNDKAGGLQEISEDFPGGLPLHSIPVVKYVTGGPGVTTVYDPQTAHTRAGDPGFEVRLPETCGLCYATSIAQASYNADEAEAQ